MYRLTFTPLASARRTLDGLPRPIIHLGGFTSGLALRGADELFGRVDDTERLAAEVVSFIVTNASTLVWGGQDYAPDSFTALVLRALQAEPSLELVAFIHESSRSKFSAAWSKPPVSSVKVQVITVRESDAAQLAARAVEATRSTELVLFGGDDTAVAAVQACRVGTPHLSSSVVAVQSWNKGSRRMDWSPTLRLDGVRIIGEAPPLAGNGSHMPTAGTRFDVTISLIDVTGVDADDVPSGGELSCRVALKQPTLMRFKRSKPAPCRGGSARLGQIISFEDIGGVAGKLVIDVWARGAVRGRSHNSAPVAPAAGAPVEPAAH